MVVVHCTFMKYAYHHPRLLDQNVGFFKTMRAYPKILTNIQKILFALPPPAPPKKVANMPLKKN